MNLKTSFLLYSIFLLFIINTRVYGYKQTDSMYQVLLVAKDIESQIKITHEICLLNNKDLTNKSALYLSEAILKNKNISQCDKALLYTSISKCYIANKDYTKVLDFSKKTLDILNKSTCNQVSKKNMYQDIAAVYNYKGENKLAIENYLYGLEIALKEKDTLYIGKAYYNIGNIYFSLMLYDKSIENYTKTIAYNNNSKDYIRTLGFAYDGLARIHMNNGTYDKAQQNFEKAIALFDKIHKDDEKYNVLNNLGINYELQENFDTALSIYKNVYNYYVATNNQTGIANICMDLGSIYNTTGDYTHAISMVDTAYKKYAQVGLLHMQREALQLQYENYKAKGDFKNALINFENYKYVDDSINNKSNIEKITSIKKDFEYGIEKEKYNAKIANYRLKMFSAIALFIVCILMSIIYFIYNKRKQANEDIKKQEAFTYQLLQNSEEERARIAGELHDGVNHNLLSLKNQVMKGQSIDADKIHAVIEEVRNVSRNLHPAMFENIGLEASIQELCNRVTEETNLFTSCEIEYKNILSKQKELQIYRIIQEALQNTIKHGKAQAAKVTLHTNENYLWLEVKDNGAGFNVNEKLNSPKSFGLQSLIQRAKSLTAKCEVSSNPTGTIIKINIPI